MRYSIRIRPLELFPTKERELFFAPFVGVQDGIDESNVSERACTPDTSTVVHDDPVVATEVQAYFLLLVLENSLKVARTA